MKKPLKFIRVPDNQTHRLPEGEHQLTVIRADLRWQKNRFGELYKALHLTFADDHGQTATSMTPEFRSGIVVALTALGDPALTLRDLTPERLMRLRGRRVRGTVSHRAYRNSVYTNVTAINGRPL